MINSVQEEKDACNTHPQCWGDKETAKGWRARQRNNGGLQSFTRRPKGPKRSIGKLLFFLNKVPSSEEGEELIQANDADSMRKDGTLWSQLGSLLVLKHLMVGGIWQDTKEREATTSATCWWTALVVGCLQPISCVQSMGQISV